MTFPYWLAVLFQGILPVVVLFGALTLYRFEYENAVA